MLKIQQITCTSNDVLVIDSILRTQNLCFPIHRRRCVMVKHCRRPVLMQNDRGYYAAVAI